MDRFGSGALGGGEQVLDVEVRGRRRRFADQECLVGVTHVQRVSVGLGVDRDGADAELAQRPQHADGDLTSVGDEYLREHRGPRRVARPSGSLTGQLRRW